MTAQQQERVCKNCGFSSIGPYCNHCGQPHAVKRITLSKIIHEVFHYFTHLDKGFPYTLKKLIIAPGKMQREYISGSRSNHQKPFSMFFLCATVAALIFYWINTALIKYYDAGDPNEASFFNQYMVILQVVMLPVYALITFLFFYNTRYNYAEVLVLLLYTLSFSILLIALVQSLKLIWPHLETRYIELPAGAAYGVLTNVSFFSTVPEWVVIIKSILVTAACFLLAAAIQDWLIDILS